MVCVGDMCWFIVWLHLRLKGGEACVGVDVCDLWSRRGGIVCVCLVECAAAAALLWQREEG
eukprot:EC785385.1.p2 GENE.EC785385.1~~EC785385.1.p2  ORF type:complete len:61 (+),score=7.24 EC785385.1:59-241(+)